MAVEIRAFLRCPKHPAYLAHRQPKSCRFCWEIYYTVQGIVRECKSYRLRFFTRKVTAVNGVVQ